MKCQIKLNIHYKSLCQFAYSTIDPQFVHCGSFQVLQGPSIYASTSIGHLTDASKINHVKGDVSDSEQNVAFTIRVGFSRGRLEESCQEARNSQAKHFCRDFEI